MSTRGPTTTFSIQSESPAAEEEIALRDISGNPLQQTSPDSVSIAMPPPSDPPPTARSKTSPPGYYLPNSPAEMFLTYEDEKRRMKGGEKPMEEEELSRESEKEAVEEETEDPIGALNRRQTRLYRTLVWAQFSMTVFTCIFILIIMILVAIILVMLQRTIDRADHAIRDNPVSQVYLKLKNAVNKINI